MTRAFYVYMLASRPGGTLYIGVTTDLERRVQEHQLKQVPGFTAKYNVNRLVWFEEFFHASDAFDREKQLKGWVRAKKAKLIAIKNPNWHDLYATHVSTQDASSVILSERSEPKDLG